MHKKIFFYAFVFILSIKTDAQYNLVPNYSFEQYSFCPNSWNQLSSTNWINPTSSGSPDYYNACSANYSVPNTACSGCYQYANTGVGFVGIALYSDQTVDVREYIQNQLTDTLVNSQCYLIKFYVNLVNNAKYALNNIGCYLSINNISLTGSSYLMNYNPQINETAIIADTLNWIQISGIYVALGGENYITIGNFKDDLNNTISIINSSGAPISYIFIDDVSVLPIDSIPGGMPAYAGADTNVIVGDSVFIGQQISNLNCNWYNAIGGLIASGTSVIYVSPTTTTTFVVEQELCGNLTYDTVKVSVTVGVDELLNENNVQIYPNPTTGELTIELINQNNEWLTTILDVQGRTVVEKSFTGTKINLKLELANGVYLVRVTNKNTNEMVMKKLVVSE